MKVQVFLVTFFAGLMLFTTACNKPDEDMLLGVWEYVNVADIHSEYAIEWEFFDGELTIYRRSKTNPEDVRITDRGFYLLESTPLKTTLRLLETSNQQWNNHWDVIRFKNDELIINMDIEGGVLFKEFVKIR